MYSHVAHTLNITAVDVHARAPRRLMQHFSVKKQRHVQSKNKAKRLLQLRHQIAEFEKREGELPGRIIERNLDLMLILSTRRNYEKAHKEKTTKLDEIRLFETITADLIKNYMADYLRKYPDSTLAEISHEEAEVKGLLLRIFELDTTARNRLVVTISECKSLYGQVRLLV